MQLFGLEDDVVNELICIKLNPLGFVLCRLGVAVCTSSFDLEGPRPARGGGATNKSNMNGNHV